MARRAARKNRSNSVRRSAAGATSVVGADECQAARGVRRRRTRTDDFGSPESAAVGSRCCEFPARAWHGPSSRGQSEYRADQRRRGNLLWLAVPISCRALAADRRRGAQDATTNRPLVNVRVVSNTFAGRFIFGVHVIESVSDAEGRYRIDGMPKGKGNTILAIPGDDQPHFIRKFEVPAAEGFRR